MVLLFMVVVLDLFSIVTTTAIAITIFHFWDFSIFIMLSFIDSDFYLSFGQIMSMLKYVYLSTPYINSEVMQFLVIKVIIAIVVI